MDKSETCNSPIEGTIFVASSGATQSNRLGINWRFILFTFFMVIVGGLGTLHGLIYSTISPNTWLLAFAYFILTELSITMGYHRLFSHKAYSAHWTVRLIILLLASASFQQSAMIWCSEHRDHHKFVDTPLDPYNIQQGFFYAHIGWLFHHYKREQSNVNDLHRDPLLRWQAKYWISIGIMVGFVLPAIIAGFWHDALNGFIVAGLFRTLFVWQCTFSVNSFAHYIGKKNYARESSSRDSWLVALLTFGEGYHNFHHAFPYDYRNGIKWYHFDPSKWMIRLLAVFGLAKDLKRASADKIASKKEQV